ncbi:type II toxin-antitoxin system death-on-curing family toxin [Lacrimispora sp.]|uniref:type II toxin-antitoxin system death-on-curing family toxin n=1 Tax=Lacrimispora sp. TaxID=2719234 RepID=UPI0028AC7FCE|nr:type II toxin-antitoxin system death-on-curing family toxin [Lacrimispora sp.]
MELNEGAENLKIVHCGDKVELTLTGIHSILIKKSGGLDGVSDNNLLESALQAPFQTFGGDELYPTIQKKAACLCYGLVNNHSFIDGNKRIGILVLMTFLQLNGMPVDCTDDELIRLGLGLASGEVSRRNCLNGSLPKLINRRLLIV